MVDSYRERFGYKGIVVMALAVVAAMVPSTVQAKGVGAMSDESKPGVENWLPNPSFEEAKDGQPVGWKPHEWKGEGKFDCADLGRTGGRSLSIASDKGADFSWETFANVQPFSTYRLSGWIKTEGVVATTGEGALINIHGMPVKTDALTGTHDWTQVEVIFKTEDQDTLHINCLFGGWGFATGQAWYDDLKLELVSAKELNPEIVINAAKTGAPISKYIYGQFIEHLGRCIYGGIWAEMLEDRKFFYAVGAKGSPWEILGLEDAAVMVTERPYVGEREPGLRPAVGAAGIAQAGLGLRKGKQYVGRAVLAGGIGAGPVDVTLAWGPGADEQQTVTIENITGEYQRLPFEFTAGADTDNGQLNIIARGNGAVRVGAVSLMPADNVHGMREDTLALLKELDAPVYRWPGGNFVSGYDWKDAIGDPDKRPPRKNPAWKGVEHNDFGLDEFIAFCRELDTEPLVVVNSGRGDVTMAVQELEYANGAADTPMGQLRAENGHPEPYGVNWWGIGNEMYGAWQLGHMPLEDYAKKHNEFADAMRAADPSIKLIAVGATGKWSETILTHCADHMDLLSEHFYVGEKPGLLSHVRQMSSRVRHKATAHRRYHETIEALAGKKIPIALDEWNYWYGPELYGQIGVRYFLRDALGVAAAIHEMTRHSDVFLMANYAQTVNVIGAIKTSKTDAAFATTGLALKLYRHHYGTVPVEVGGDPVLLDVAAAWTDGRKALTVGIVNPSEQAFDVPFSLEGAELTGTGRRWIITGDDPMLYNEPGKPPQVEIEEAAVKGVKDTLEAPPLSVVLYELAVRQ